MFSLSSFPQLPQPPSCEAVAAEGCVLWVLVCEVCDMRFHWTDVGGRSLRKSPMKVRFDPLARSLVSIGGHPPCFGGHAHEKAKRIWGGSSTNLVLRFFRLVNSFVDPWWSPFRPSTGQARPTRRDGRRLNATNDTAGDPGGLDGWNWAVLDPRFERSYTRSQFAVPGLPFAHF